MKTILFKAIRKKRYYALLLALGFLAWVWSFMDMRLSAEAFQEALADNPYGYQADVCAIEGDGRTLCYTEIGNDSLPLIVFIHGAPSSSSFWKDMLKDSLLLSKAKLLAVDRPGYGYSGYGKPETSVRKQASLIARLIQEKSALHSAIILHGSSYGGTVAARIAMDFPHLVDGLLLQSASVAPGKEKTYQFTYITENTWLRWLLPGSIHVANQEKLTHQIELDSMANLWNRIKAAVVVLHGKSDGLIYPENAFFAQERLTNASFLDVKVLENRKHDLLWTRRDLLIKSLEQLLHLGEKQALNR
ncbi:MAG TPA: alpha/beta hydrolase [Saprospiraceae bacterium]|nr:alpha/beta hydrolase [Saprospiraceae bacterium]HMQ84263.1 alpha/beta hydrolase [Saprospiraceae bacterium]